MFSNQQVCFCLYCVPIVILPLPLFLTITLFVCVVLQQTWPPTSPFFYDAVWFWLFVKHEVFWTGICFSSDCHALSNKRFFQQASASLATLLDIHFVEQEVFSQASASLARLSIISLWVHRGDPTVGPLAIFYRPCLTGPSASIACLLRITFCVHQVEPLRTLWLAQSHLSQDSASLAIL